MPDSFITLWDMNSNPPDDMSSTGTLDPAIGTGTLMVIGTVTNSFGSVAGGGSSDPATADNAMLRLGNFAPQGTDNKTSGLELRVSTEGKKNISFMWDHYNSNTGSRYWRVQYSTNGFDFLDYEVFTNTAATTWHNRQMADLSDLPGVTDNPNFALRFVSEFESTATGSGNDEYDAVNDTSNYGTAGTLWVDRLAIAGDPLDQSTPVNLTLTRSGDQIEISWPASAAGYQLQSADSLTSPQWEPVPQVPSVSNGRNVVQLPSDQTQEFFRLTE